MLARGLGEYWIDDDSLCFRRYLTRNPIRVPLRRVVAVERGKWHAGRWVGGERAIKLVWERDGIQLSSGFVLTRTAAEAETRASELRALIAKLR
jgi:hypothetical protein